MFIDNEIRQQIKCKWPCVRDYGLDEIERDVWSTHIETHYLQNMPAQLENEATQRVQYPLGLKGIHLMVNLHSSRNLEILAKTGTMVFCLIFILKFICTTVMVFFIGKPC